MRDGKKIFQDDKAQSRTQGMPAFLSRPEGAPIYYGFPLVEETRTDGWCFGAITEFQDPQGCNEGDGFVIAPHGSRAGLAWSVGDFAAREICPPDETRWGVYEVAFAKAVRTVDDLVQCFRTLLPELEAIHAWVRRAG